MSTSNILLYNEEAPITADMMPHGLWSDRILLASAYK
jgi:hypothetical protein